MDASSPHAATAARGALRELATDLRDDRSSALIQRMLRAARRHLDMEVAFVAEFRGGQRVFRCVDSDLPTPPVQPGDSDPLEDSYCARIVDGRLPRVIHDASRLPEARGLPVTGELPVGAHISVPIVLSTGAVYGTFCCFSRTADSSLRERDVGLLEMLAAVVADIVEQSGGRLEEPDDLRERVWKVIDEGGPRLVFQPIFDLSTGTTVGLEALARFPAGSGRSVSEWFDDAWACGLGADLELAVLRSVAALAHQVPDDVYLSVNLSPRTALTADFLDALSELPRTHLVLEITEHAHVESYESLMTALETVMDEGIRVAVDDAGAGVSSLSHVLQMSPDIIKLDVSLTADIDTHVARQALASALVTFASRVDSVIVAEGIETPEQLNTLRILGVEYGQGFWLCRPGDLSTVLARQAHSPRGRAAGLP